MDQSMMDMMKKNKDMTAKRFFDWAYTTRAKNVQKLYNHEQVSMEKMFLSFCSHEPAFVSNGPCGLNASVKGVGFIPKDEYLEDILKIYIEHIKTYDPKDPTYSERGLALLLKYLYSDEAKKYIDFTRIGSLEMAKKQSYHNYLVNKEACLIFHQPPMISYKLKGKVEIYDETTSKKREIYQQFINAQHDMYHVPDMTRWLKYPAYIFTIEEVYDNSATESGFGTKLQYPYDGMND